MRGPAVPTLKTCATVFARGSKVEWKAAAKTAGVCVFFVVALVALSKIFSPSTS
jgi:hypothetical protein